nr:GNAT family protein [Motilibacter deserti]
MTGARAVLRELRRDDVALRHAAVAGDPELHAVTDVTPWRPQPLERALAAYDKQLAEEPDRKVAWFAVARRDDPELACVGDAGLWGIDEHQRTAHLGITVFPAARGQGLGTDVVRLLCAYAFRDRGLHRLQAETLASNTGMRRAALASGFTEEGRLRESAYVLGDRVDEVLFGLLRAEWLAAAGGGSAG